jgi:hypothetical protein
MGNDVRWWKQDSPEKTRKRNTPDSGMEVPGDTEAPDIVGRTGEEMPEVAHDEVDAADGNADEPLKAPNADR